MTAICAAIGAQPIPLADFPILTSLQATMVAAIMHISGREMSAKLAGEFMAAVGANVGLGLALREGARAAVKFLPVLGQRHFRRDRRGRHLLHRPRCRPPISSKAAPCKDARRHLPQARKGTPPC